MRSKTQHEELPDNFFHFNSSRLGEKASQVKGLLLLDVAIGLVKVEGVGPLNAVLLFLRTIEERSHIDSPTIVVSVSKILAINNKLHYTVMGRDARLLD